MVFIALGMNQRLPPTNMLIASTKLTSSLFRITGLHRWCAHISVPSIKRPIGFSFKALKGCFRLLTLFTLSLSSKLKYFKKRLNFSRFNLKIQFDFSPRLGKSEPN